MNDRVVDRAAAHATPAELAMRDWLLVGLSFATGIYEAICFLTFGKVFTAAMTGNLVLLGIGVAGTRQPAGPNPVTVVIALVTWSLTAHSAWRLTATMVGMAAGACLGDLMLSHAHRYAPVVPVAVTAVVIAIAWVALKPRAAAGPAGEPSLPVQQTVK
jgi:uncharacterized membrane protein YoaK (UPF0700 family)